MATISPGMSYRPFRRVVVVVAGVQAAAILLVLVAALAAAERLLVRLPRKFQEPQPGETRLADLLYLRRSRPFLSREALC